MKEPSRMEHSAFTSSGWPDDYKQFESSLTESLGILAEVFVGMDMYRLSRAVACHALSPP